MIVVAVQGHDEIVRVRHQGVATGETGRGAIRIVERGSDVERLVVVEDADVAPPDEGAWTIPAPRTKAAREHRVPLCRRPLETLEKVRTLGRGSPLVFPSVRGKPLAITALWELLRELGIAAVPHGFRSSFRDWAAEETDHPREVVEAALAHEVRNQVEAQLTGARTCSSASAD